MRPEYVHRRILSWLHSVVPAQDDRSSERPRKRSKLNTSDFIHSQRFKQISSKEGSRISRLPTPSVADFGSARLSTSSSMALTGPKNKSDGGDDARLEDDDQGQGQPFSNLPLLQTDLTPRPTRRKAAALDDDCRAFWLPSPSKRSSSLASSRASKISRNSSPTKQLRNAELEETGFLRASIRDDAKPSLLNALAAELKKIDRGFGILPKDLQDDLANDDSIAFWNFGDTPEFSSTQLPGLSTVRQIYDLAKRCFKNNHPESSWNNDVHSRILNLVLRDGPCKDDLVDYRCCLTAQIAPDYQPINSPSKMVDYCICIQPETNSPQYQAIESLCKTRPAKSINHTDWADLTKYPIAISIETKGPSIGYETALLQVATWHSAQWRSLYWPRQERNISAPTCEIEFLPGIVVMQHHWWFVATALNEQGKAQTYERLLLGETESILGIYKLSMSLLKLVEWAKDQHWPAFQADVLGLSPDGNGLGDEQC